ncbi:MAG: RidA family protein [Proteobacteria bacterium]|nr:RidA family protein [Pseudomonadota bacterium]
MGIRRIKVGPRMSQAVVQGNVVHTAGQVALNAAGEGAAEQTKDILAAIDSLLAEAGTDKSNLLTANIWLSDMADFKAMNEVWDAWVVKGNTPTRACVESKLAAPQFNVEIAVTAAITSAIE